MAKRINKPAVAITTLVVMGLTIIAGVLLVKSLKSTDPKPMATAAEAALAKGDYQAAVNLYKTAFSVSQEAKWLVLAGDAARDMGDAGTAFGLWRAAFAKDPNFAEARRHYVEMWLELLELSDWQIDGEGAQSLAEQANVLLQSAPDDFAGRLARGISYLALRAQQPEREAEGLADLQKALTLRPGDPQVLAVLGQYWLAKDQPEQAAKLYAEVIQAQPDREVGYLMMGRHLIGQEKPEEAIEQLQTAASKAPDSPAVLTALAQAHGLKKEYARAEELLQKAIQADPEFFEAHLQRAALLSQNDKPRQALEVIEQWLAKPPITKGFRANHYRGQRLRLTLQAASVCVALAAGERAAGGSGEEPLKQAEKYTADAEKLMGQDSPWVLMLRADIHRQRGRAVEAIKLLERADTGFASRNPDVKLRLAELYRQQGELGASQRMLADLLRLAPRYVRSYLLLAEIATQLGNPTDAIAQLDAGLKIEPDNRDLLQMKMVILASQDRPEARQIEQQLGKAATTAELLQRANLRLLEDKFAEAESLLEQVLAAEPANLSALRLLLQRLVQTDRTEVARQFWAKAQAAAPDDLEVRSLEFLLATGLSPEQREQKIVEMIQAEKNDVVRNTQLYAYYVTRQKFDEAQRAADALESLTPDEPRVIRMQFALALQGKKWDRARKYLEMAASRNIDGADGSFMRADLARAQENWPEARSHLEEALRKFPSTSTGWVQLAEVLIRQQQYAQAKDVLTKKVLDLSPGHGPAYRYLAAIAELEGDQAGYRENLRKAAQYAPNDPWVAARALELLGQEDPRAAVAARKRMLEANPGDLDNMIRLAGLYETLNPPQYEAAAELFEKALVQAPKNVAVGWAAAQYYHRRGDSARAEKILVDLEKQAEGLDKARANLLLGGLYAELKQIDKAEQAMLVATQQSPGPETYVALADFYGSVGRVPAAVAALRQAVGTMAKDDARQAAVRRSLIDLLLRTGDLAGADSEIEAYRQALPEDSMYQLLRSAVLMQRGRPEEAIAALTEYLQKNSGSIDGYYRRGLLYLGTNRPANAIEDLQAAKTLNEKAFEYGHRIALAQAYELAGQPDRAVTELQGILQNDPQAVGVARALIGLYQRTKRHKDLETLITGYIVRDPTDAAWPMLLGASWEKAGDMAKAAEGYERAARVSSYSVQAVNELLRVWVADKQYDKVIQYVQSVLPESARIHVAKARLAEAFVGKGQTDKARALFAEALSEASSRMDLSVLVIRIVAAALSIDEATQMLRQQLVAQPANQALRYMLVTVLATQGKYDEALQVSSEMLAAAQTDGDKAIVYRQRASVLHNASRFQESATAYEELLKVAPDDPEALNNLAYIFAENLGRPAEALPYAKKAVALSGQNADVLDTLGWVYYLAGDLDNALGTLISARQLAPANVAVLAHLGMVYKKRNEMDKARRELEEAEKRILAAPNDSIARMFRERVEKELKELRQ